MTTDLTRLHAHHMAARLRAGEVTSRELTEAHLDLAEAQDHGLHAWLTIDRDRALAEADAADARLAAARGEGREAVRALHPLLGIPVGLKDLVSVKGGQCTAGSRILEGYHAPYDAHITERLRDVGAVILGKTNMDEFAMGSSTEHSAYGPTANPWGLDRVPGGSSGGSAAAVAAYHVPLSIGTDTGGSIRQPAALTGIVGLKPTYGRVSRYGIVAFASSLDQIGPFARDVRGAAALLHAVAGRDERDSTSSPEPVSGRAADPRPQRRRGGRLAARQAPGPAARVLRRRDGAGRRGARPRGGGGARGGRRDRRGGRPAAHGIRPRDVLHRGPGRGVGQPRPLRRHPLRPAARARAGRPRRLSRDPWPAVRAGGEAPDHARDVRALGRLLRRLLPQGAEGPHADQGRLRRALGAGLRRARRPDLADRRVPVRRPAGRSGLDVPVGRVHAAGQHGRPARASRSRRAVGGAAGRAAAHRRAVVGARAVQAGPRLRGDHRRRRLARAWSQPAWPRSTTLRRPRPPSASRAASGATA